ncbi:MAG: TolC family protein [Prevotellaceae bacterium]|nr:TolC family protein [Prevotellaceae bacterium]
MKYICTNLTLPYGGRWRGLYRLSLIVAVLIVPFAMHAQSKAWTLDECINYALDHNIEVQQRINKQRVAENTLEDSKNAWKPVVDAQLSQDLTLNKAQSGYDFLSYDRTNTTAQIDASMPLYTFGRLKYKKISDEFSLKAVAEDLRYSQKQVEINVIAGYLQVLYNRTEVKVAQEKLDASTSTLKQTKIFYDEGKKPKGDVVQAEATVSEDEYTLLKAKNDVKLSLIRLAQLLNLNDIEGFDVADIADDNVQIPTIDFAGSIEKYPSVIAAKYRIESAENQIKLAKSDFMPTLSLTGTAGNQYSILFNQSTPSLWTQLKNRYNLIVGLNLKYNLFNGGATKRKVSLAQINKVDAQLSLEESKQQIHHDIQNAYYDALTARDKQISAEKAARLAKESLGYVESSYQAGRATIFDLVQSQQHWLQNLEESVRSKYDYILKNKILEIYQR